MGKGQEPQMASKYVKAFYLIKEQRNRNKTKNEVLVLKAIKLKMIFLKPGCPRYTLIHFML